MSYGRDYYAGTDYGDVVNHHSGQVVRGINNERFKLPGESSPPPYTGRINEDFQAGVWAGMMRAALAVENHSLAKEGSTYAQIIKRLARHDQLKVEAMMKEGKLV